MARVSGTAALIATQFYVQSWRWVSASATRSRRP